MRTLLCLALIGPCLACSTLSSRSTVELHQTERAREGDRNDPESRRVDLYSAPLRLQGQPSNTPVEVDTLPAPGTDTTAAKPKGREFFLAPVPFRDSQIGLGLAVMGGVIFPLDEDPETPPSTIALAGFYSENDSYGGFGFGRLHTRGDRWRLKFGGGSALSNYDFYGIGSGAGDNGISLPFETRFNGLKVEALGRISEHSRIGPAMSFFDATTRVRSSAGLPPELQPEAFDAFNTALGLHFERDTRDNTFSPREGDLLTVKGDFFSESLGGDFSYRLWEAQYAAYPSLNESTVLAWRVRGKALANNEGPFYALPQYDARGYQKGRYRDEVMVGGEVELRRKFTDRIGGVLFAGLGEVAPSFSKLNFDDLLPSAGLGLRIQLTKKNPLYYSIDFAIGENESILYFSVGEAF